MLNWMTKYVEDNEEIWKKEGEDLFESEKTTLEAWKKLSTPKKKRDIEECQTDKSEKSTRKDKPVNMKSTTMKTITTPPSLTATRPSPPDSVKLSFLRPD